VGPSLSPPTTSAPSRTSTGNIFSARAPIVAHHHAGTDIAQRRAVTSTAGIHRCSRTPLCPVRRTGGHLAAKLASGAPAVPAAGAHHAALNTRPRCHALPADGPHSGCTASASACARRWAAARSDSRAARAGSPKRTNSASASSCIRAARKCAANALSHAKRTRSENIVQTKLPRPRATEQPHEHELAPQIPCVNVVIGLVGGRCRGQGGGVSTPASRSGSREPPTRGGLPNWLARKSAPSVAPA